MTLTLTMGFYLKDGKCNFFPQYICIFLDELRLINLIFQKLHEKKPPPQIHTNPPSQILKWLLFQKDKLPIKCKVSISIVIKTIFFIVQVSLVMVIGLDKIKTMILDMIKSRVLRAILDKVWNCLIVSTGMLILSGFVVW